MSTDRNVTDDLITTLEDGREGFTKAADKLAGESPAVSAVFREFAAQRAEFSRELETMAAAYGDDIERDGSVIAAAHRGWMTLKDALTGTDADAVIAVAEQGEEYAVRQYEMALEQDISPTLRTVVERQSSAVRAAKQRVSDLRVTS